MNKPIFSVLGYFLIGLFAFLLFAPTTQALTARSGEACLNGTSVTNPINCEPGVNCDVSADLDIPCERGQRCNGICKKACGVYSGGPANGGCADDEDCYLTAYTSGYGGNGYCVLKTSHHIPMGSTCTREVLSCVSDQSCERNNEPERKRGNCKDINANCDMQLDPNCRDGRCTGRCIPTTPYTCNKEADSRPDVAEFSCPLGYSCGEVAGREQVTRYEEIPNCMSVDGMSCMTAYITCPDCQFGCFATAQIKATCTCADEGNPGDGANRIICQNSRKTIDDVFCNHVGYACYETPDVPIDPRHLDQEDYNKLIHAFPGQNVTGVKCRSNAEREAEIAAEDGSSGPPPPPPCNVLIAGLCTEVITAFGNVGTDPAAFISRLFGILLAASGAIALLLIMRAGYRIMTARGSQEGLKEGREQLVAAIVGLMFLIFSFVLLQVIGVDLLQLPNSNSGLIPEFGTCDVNNPRCEDGFICQDSGAQGQCLEP